MANIKGRRHFVPFSNDAGSLHDARPVPLPDWAKEELSDLKGHQKTDLISGDESAEITEAYDRARRDVVEAQVDAGLDRVVEGQLRWDDMIAHPLAVADSVDTRGIVRYYDNNNFYRGAGRHRRPRRRATSPPNSTRPQNTSIRDCRNRPSRPVLAFRPGDRRALRRRGRVPRRRGRVPGRRGRAVPRRRDAVPARALARRERARRRRGRAGQRAIDKVAAAVDADVVAHTYWGAIEEKVYAHLMDADVDAIGFDLIADHEQTIYNVQEYGTKDSVALSALVDGQNTLVETPETIRERIDWFAEQTAGDYDTVYATANTETFYLPVNKFEAKLEALAEAGTRGGASLMTGPREQFKPENHPERPLPADDRRRLLPQAQV